MMKKFLTIILICSIIMLVGCSETSKVETLPWNDSQISQLEQDKVETVPLAVLRF